MAILSVRVQVTCDCRRPPFYNLKTRKPKKACPKCNGTGLLEDWVPLDNLLDEMSGDIARRISPKRGPYGE